VQGQPWSDDDIAILTDLVACGYPPAAIGKRLDRTATAVAVRARLIGIRIRPRTQRKTLHICLEQDVIDRLKLLADRRGIHSRHTQTGCAAVMVRILVELLVRDVVLCGNLLDDIER
jgi:hypothetical protein